MANGLDELNDNVLESGRDINVIAKQLPVKVGVGSKIFEVLLWVCGIIPGVVFLFKKIKAAEYLRKLEQKLQHDASTVDNYLTNRVVILQNLAKLVDKAVTLDKETFVELAAARNGKTTNPDEARNDLGGKIDNISAMINVAVERYPELKAHQEIQDAIQQNSYLQQEITAAREVYNDTVNSWNHAIQEWPTKMIVAAKQGYTTRIPFAASKEIKEKANDVFF